MDDRMFLATDLDRTILPNGKQQESPEARERFRRLVRHAEVEFAYVSGRGEVLLREAIATYDLPVPRFAIGDVGSVIYDVRNGYAPLRAWEDAIAPDWKGRNHDAMRALFGDIGELTLQEEEKQNTYKLSYYAPETIDRPTLLRKMQKRLETQGVDASLIWSVDETTHTGLLDVLPQSATKLYAVRFLQTLMGFSDAQTIYCGDSGNDLPILTSGMQSVLVANATDDVRSEAVASLHRQGIDRSLYCAHGGLLGMNGNYAAGALEGIAHFFPHTVAWMVE